VLPNLVLPNTQADAKDVSSSPLPSGTQASEGTTMPTLPAWAFEALRLNDVQIRLVDQ
jgi:hypothetical protein